jgi:5-methylcytosine-specific restriction endonuclease McrA
MFGLRKFIRYAYRSPKWSSVRKQHLSSQPNCAACGRDKKLEVHHIEPVHLNPDRELDPSNLITLCDDPCHLLFGHLLDYKSWNKDVVNDCAVYLNKVKNKPHK